MPRPRLPVGEHGKISRRELPDGRWVATCWVRDEDGKRRQATKQTPLGIRDKHGAVAERTLLESLKTRHVQAAGQITGTSSVHYLWTELETQLITQGKAENTLKDYRRQSKHILQRLGDLQIREVTTQALDSFVQDVAVNRGVPTARKNRTILLGMFKIAVRYNAIPVNPIRELTSIAGKRKKRARSLDPESLAALLRDLRTSDVPCPVILAPYQLARGQKTSSTDIPTVAKFCASNDMADIITMFAATGCRIGELLAIRWEDVDLDAKTLKVTGKIIRVPGKGLVRETLTKSEAGDDRSIPMPAFAMAVLKSRRKDSATIFESRAGTLLDPETVGRRWRQIRAALDLEWVTSHTFRKTVATILDDEGLSARQAADHLGHAQVSMTQDVYFGRGRVHTAAAEALDGVISGRPPRSQSVE
ncbi:tyrosine-type recombinase/integrase [Rhodococcus sp. (in: high G+C Gram-positive bacteria)]|uniref:site-specific integrase n=1 Tax=Rhodococcus sp. TaxID=1831 RepID=UPI001A2BB81D|nr:tyrosine-type recombinase/integrase [Rhodococcus sp. (in: high G+C Gram-positive bacteria)]MBJ7479223.1 tyrosine-type recombinase/integrase [Rhodococcus sp. (in: high G+C Gram-positive bacteria)]